MAKAIQRSAGMKVAFVGNETEIERVFRNDRRERIEAQAEVFPGVLSIDDPRLATVDALFSTWGMPQVSADQLDRMPCLKAAFYAAGTVSYFASPLVAKGIQISSAWQANAIPVAEFTASQILLSTKGFFRNVREYRAERNRAGCGAGTYGETVALLGAGAVGRRVVERLSHSNLNIVVYDPFLSEEDARSLGVMKVSLETAFSTAIVVSNHLLDVENTVGLITEDLVESMRPGATIINTGRGRILGAGFERVILRRPDLTALLDVTDPEPLPPNHPLWDLPNVVLSSHIAGSVGDEVLRLADWAIEEFERFQKGEPLLYRVYG